MRNVVAGLISTKGSTMLMGRIRRYLFQRNDIDENYGRKEYAVAPDFHSRKITEIASPSDCLGWGDRPGWLLTKMRLAFQPCHFGSFIVSTPYSIPPKYTFGISRRHASRANMAFLDGHVEHGSLRDWILPVSAVWYRWHHRNQMPVELFRQFDADNWAPLYGADEFVPTTSEN